MFTMDFSTKKWKAVKENKYERAAYYREKECRMLNIETSFKKFLKNKL